MKCVLIFFLFLMFCVNLSKEVKPSNRITKTTKQIYFRDYVCIYEADILEIRNSISWISALEVDF